MWPGKPGEQAGNRAVTDSGSVEPKGSGDIRTLAIDVGGTGLKASLLDAAGDMVTDRVRVDTPVGASPDKFVEVLTKLVAPLGAFDRISVGFPGVVRKGRILTAPNLGNDAWKGYELADRLTKALGKPVRIANDSELAGLAVISGKGVEATITLGTGFGSSFFQDGRPGPHLEVGHHPFRHGETYDEQVGNAALKSVGGKRWNRRVAKAIANMRVLTNFDHLYIGGGNARKINFDLAGDVTVVPNEAGIKGGVMLWKD